ncbi:MAG: hypothetical protein AAB394_04140 [Patescibacteria group bacterium]
MKIELTPSRFKTERRFFIYSTISHIFIIFILIIHYIYLNDSKRSFINVKIDNMRVLKKNSFSKIILEKISEAGEIALEGLFPKNRAEGRLWRSILGLPQNYEFSRPSFSSILSKLSHDGLIKRNGSRKRAFWLVTSKGKEKIKAYIRYMKPVKADGMPRLVIYDIPEVDKRKRNLIRSELVACNYQQLQRSVWLGYSPLPEDFVKSLEDMRLENKVHIISIQKKGTLGIL